MENQILDNDLVHDETNLHIVWAGFWVRVGASFIDFLVYSPLIAFNMYNLYMLKNLPIQLLVNIIMILYKPFMEYKYGATLGKMAVKIKVVNKNYKSISLSQSLVRYSPWILGQIFSIYSTILLFQHPEFISSTEWMEVGNLQNKIIPPAFNVISSLILFISCIIVGFTQKKQGLHDMMAGTYCIYKES